MRARLCKPCFAEKASGNHNIGVFEIGQNFLARTCRAKRLHASQRGGGVVPTARHGLSSKDKPFAVSEIFF